MSKLFFIILASLILFVPLPCYSDDVAVEYIYQGFDNPLRPDGWRPSAEADFSFDSGRLRIVLTNRTYPVGPVIRSSLLRGISFSLPEGLRISGLSVRIEGARAVNFTPDLMAIYPVYGPLERAMLSITCR